jgi:hypothetical protein
MVQRIGRYEVQAELGRGGFGRVYRAFDPTVGRAVAIKTLHADGDPELLLRFRNEAAAAGKLRHPNIVVIHDYGEQDGEPYIVMELLEGEDLQHCIRTHRPFSIMQKLQIMAQVAEGLDHAHRNGIVHRDVKPGNIMLLPDSTVKIMDFGIALVTHAAESRLTKSGTVPGTLKYMAPEQFRGAADSKLSDTFAFGVTFYEFICGVHPFEGPSQHAVMFNIVQAEPKPLQEMCPESPEALNQIVMTCLQKVPEMRYPSLKDLQLDMKPILLELQQEHARKLLSDAERLAGAGQAEAAHALLHEALEIDPGNRAARALREKVQRILRAQMVGPRLDALLATGRHQLDSQQFDEAIHTLEAARKLDASNKDVLTLLERAHTARHGTAGVEERSAEADAARSGAGRNARFAAEVEECRKLLERREYGPAIQKLEQCLAGASDNDEASQLLAYARQQQAAQKRQEIVSRLLREVDTLAAAHNYERAIQMLETGLGYYPGEKSIEERLRALRAAKASRLRDQTSQSPKTTPVSGPPDLVKKITSIERLLEQSQLSAAIAEAEDALGQYPGDPVLQALLRRAREQRRLRQRGESVAKALNQASELLKTQQFGAALKLIEEGLQSFPDDTQLSRARESILAAHSTFERKQILERAAVEVRSLLEREQLEQAVALCQKVLGRFPNEPAFVSFLSQAENNIQQREIRRRDLALIERDAEAHIEGGNADAALQLIEQSRRRFPEAQSLLQLFEQARRMKLRR